MKKNYNISLIIIFILIIFIPLFELKFNLMSKLGSNEKRKLAAKPEINIMSLTRFPKKYDKFFNDTFPFRNNLILVHNFIKLKYLNISPVESNVMGKNEWFYYKGLYGLWGDKPYTKEQLELITLTSNAHNDIFKKHGIYYILVIPPNKQTIYPENLPITAEKNIYGRLAQKIDYFRKHSDVPIVDLRKPLLDGKKLYPVYYKSDTHWNAYGGFIAYQEIVKSLAHRFNVIPLSLSDFSVTAKVKKADGDIVKGMYMENEFIDTEVILRAKKNLNEVVKGKKISKGIIFHDSFFEDGYPWSNMKYLRYHFDTLISITNNNPLDLDKIINEKPDVVIYEVVERSI